MKDNSIIFVTVPPQLKEKFPDKLDLSIPLPIEYEGSEESFSSEKLIEMLNKETILSGMLRVISNPAFANIPPQWVDYYRNFVLTVKPEIYHEFSSAAIVKAKNGEFEMALEINAILEGLFPASPGILLSKALILEDRAHANPEADEGENNRVLEAFEAALSAEPLLPDAFFNAGFFFIRTRDFSRAKECFIKYIESGEESEKKKEALRIKNELESQDLSDSNFRDAYDMISRGENEKGLLKIRDYIEKFPKDWNGWFVLGWVLRKLGRYDDGLESLKQAHSLGGRNSDVQNEMAICYMEKGDSVAAGKELALALQREPENIKIISNLGVLALKQNKKEEALAFFRTVIELDPNDPLAKHYLKEFNK